MGHEIESHFVDVEGMRLHYRACGEGEPVLMLHGWPTSSYLWRNILGPVAARGRRAIALDLPGFGESAKPLDASYSFPFYTRVLTAFLDAIGADRIGLAVHDLGGPIGLYWAAKNDARVERLALLNTIIYPELSWAVVAFVAVCRLPGARALMTSPWGLEQAMHIGVRDPGRRTPEMIAAVQKPFETEDARVALAKAAYGLHKDGMKDIAAWLPTVRVPVRGAYGDGDRILPDIGKTMKRVGRDVKHAQITALPGCGHFLQEDRPEAVATILSEFFARA
jgi:pimeloyl-ACP methyl ester carboxylesterase